MPPIELSDFKPQQNVCKLLPYSYTFHHSANGIYGLQNKFLTVSTYSNSNRLKSFELTLRICICTPDKFQERASQWREKIINITDTSKIVGLYMTGWISSLEKLRMDRIELINEVDEIKCCNYLSPHDVPCAENKKVWLYFFIF